MLSNQTKTFTGKEGVLMDYFTTNLMEALVKGDSVKELMRIQLEQAFNTLLQEELTAFLQYDKYDFTGYGTDNSRNGEYTRTLHTEFGPITVIMPRDRLGEFTSAAIKPYQRRVDELEQMVIKMYKKGITTREIADLLEKMYGAHYTPQTVSNMSKVMEEQVEAFHSRSVSSHYTALFLDATYLNLRRDSVSKEAVHIIIGITPKGQKEVLDYVIFPEESSHHYHEMLMNLKTRGLQEVDLFVSDGLIGLRDACLHAFPKALHQSCWVHIARNVEKAVRVQDKKEVLEALKVVYQAKDEEASKEALRSFLDIYGKVYPKLLKMLDVSSESLFSFYKMPSCIRASIYTTNLVEGFNKELKRMAKKKVQFPNEPSLDRFLCAQCIEYNRKGALRIHKGFGQLIN